MMVQASYAVGATGCLGADSYYKFAQDQGYSWVATLDHTSSAGDWTFIVSKDGKEWQVMTQTNNYPRPGFSHAIDDQVYLGTEREVLSQLENGY